MFFDIYSIRLWTCNDILPWIFLLEGGRDKLGKLFGKGVIEYENGDIVAGMFKVC